MIASDVQQLQAASPRRLLIVFAFGAAGPHDSAPAI